MTQCIGRARRYGQRRTVHVYRLVALDTVDVDVLEWREGKKLVRRADKTFTLKDESELSAEEEAENLGTGFLKKNGYYERGE